MGLFEHELNDIVTDKVTNDTGRVLLRRVRDDDKSNAYFVCFNAGTIVEAKIWVDERYLVREAPMQMRGTA